jgi:hypothetical protein
MFIIIIIITIIIINFRWFDAKEHDSIEHVMEAGSNRQDFALLDIHGKTNFNANTVINSIEGKYKHHKKKILYLIETGKITSIFKLDLNIPANCEVFKKDFITNSRLVFFCGLYNKSHGCIIGVDHYLRKCRLKCRIFVEKGDSGGLLFCMDDNKWVALGILNAAYNKTDAWFSTFSECFDEKMFELP